MTNPLRRDGHRTTEQPACAPNSVRCCGPTLRPVSGVADPHKSPTCGTSCTADATQNDSHTGVPWMLLNYTKILCSLGDEKVVSHAALSALLRRRTHKTLAHKKSPAQSHVLGEQRGRQDLPLFSPPGNTGSWCSSAASKARQCENHFAWYPQHTTSRRSGFCADPQHQRLVFVWVHNTEYCSVRMQAVQWRDVHSSAGDLSLNKKGYSFK